MSVQKHSVDVETPDISLTDAAVHHLCTYLDKHEQTKGVRFSVTKTGCSGLAYVVDYVDTIHEDDLQFAFAKDYLLCVDKKSYPFLKGMKVDYVKEGLNAKFVFNNPNQKGQCGCGESFTVDEL